MGAAPGRVGLKGGGGRGAARPAPFVRCASPQPPAPRTLSSPRGKGDYPEPPDSIKPPESKDSAIFFIVFNISDPRPPPPHPPLPSSDGRLPLRHKGTAIPSETAAGRKQNRSESQPTGTKARGRAGAGRGGRWWRGGERKGIKEGKKKQQRKRNKTKKPRGLQPAARSTKRGRGAGPERPPPAVGPRGGGLRRSRRGTYRRKAAAGGRGARGSLKRRGGPQRRAERRRTDCLLSAAGEQSTAGRRRLRHAPPNRRSPTRLGRLPPRARAPNRLGAGRAGGGERAG